MVAPSTCRCTHSLSIARPPSSRQNLALSTDSLWLSRNVSCRAEAGWINTLEVGAWELEDTVNEACSFAEALAACLRLDDDTTDDRGRQLTSRSPRHQRAAALYGACGICRGALPCRHFLPTTFRPEICMCSHGASHHACLYPTRCPETTTVRGDGVLEFPTGRTPKAHPTGEHRRRPLTGKPYDAFPPGFAGPVALRQDSTATAEVQWLARDFLSSIGPTGVRHLLGLRRTAGSLDGPLPPPRKCLLESVNRLHVSCQPKGGEKAKINPRAGPVRLTVGGRALCKHAPRARESWWGYCGGTEAEKSAQASRLGQGVRRQQGVPVARSGTLFLSSLPRAEVFPPPQYPVECTPDYRIESGPSMGDCAVAHSSSNGCNHCYITHQPRSPRFVLVISLGGTVGAANFSNGNVGQSAHFWGRWGW